MYTLQQPERDILGTAVIGFRPDASGGDRRARGSEDTVDNPSPTRLAQMLARQRDAQARAPSPSAAARRAALGRLLAAVKRNQDALCDAMAADFGSRSSVESKIGDILAVALNARHAISKVKRWMKPQKRSVELLFATNSAWIEYQPKGVVGIVAPWNFPVYLSLGPLVASLAAGNRAMIKMSEYTPHTTAALRATLAEAFTDDEVCVFGGDASVGCEFAGLRLDHLIFTGSTYVGRLVMETASKSLTPVTLELGGKSPAVVSRSGSIEDAAAKIAHGKSFNCGQICIAPDYALVPREHVDRFVAALQAHFRKMHPRGSVADPDYSNIVSPIHAARIFRLIEEASARGARVVACEDGGSGQRIPLHIILDPTDEMTVMQEEIFGPVLPIVPYDKIEEAIAYIAGRARPLALYWFGRDESELRQTLNGTHSGGVVINDWGWHVFQNDLPFGGIGASGTGSYHGVEGFHALSHARSVFRERSWFPVKWFHPPYGNLAQRLSVRIYLGPQNSSSGPKS